MNAPTPRRRRGRSSSSILMVVAAFSVLLMLLVVLLIAASRLRNGGDDGSATSSTGGGGSITLATNTPAPAGTAPAPTPVPISTPIVLPPTTPPGPTPDIVVQPTAVVARPDLLPRSLDMCQGLAIGPLEEMEAAIAGRFPMTLLTLRTSQLPQRSIQDLSDTHKIALSEFSTAAVVFQRDAIREFVKLGWLTQTQGDYILDDTRAKLEEAFRAPMPQGLIQAQTIADRHHILDIAAAVLGTSYESLKEMRKSRTIYDIAREKGIDWELRILSPALDSEQRYLDRIVGRERMSQEQENFLLEIETQRFAACLMNTWP